ncbi:MAG: hypothetical protein KAQ65_08035 [Candidatus Thorarchaeota archaeon]|nr:hypothetical protein [Candidatus Thorarchaeota archaeon]
MNIKPRFAFLSAIAVIGPALITQVRFEWGVAGMIWEIWSPFTDAMRVVISASQLGGIMFLFLRPVFVYGIYLHDKDKMTYSRALLVGVLAELQMLSVYILMIANLIITNTPFTGLPPIIPLPLLLLCGMLVLFKQERSRPQEQIFV